MVISFTQQKLILADLSKKKKKLRKCERKKNFFEAILNNPYH